MKIVQSDIRGQIVIPKKIRKQLDIGEEAAFWVYVDNNNIVLKKIEKPKLKNEKKIVFRKKERTHQ